MKYLFIALALTLSHAAHACDICSIYMKMGMNDRRSSIGLSYRSQFFSGMISSLNGIGSTRHFDPYELSKYDGEFIEEQYVTADLRLNYWINDRFTVFAFLPIRQVTRRVNDEETLQYTRVSDPGFLFKYQLFNAKNSEDNRLFYRMIVGTGFKAPLGSTQVYLNENYLNPDLQPGSGSYDLLFSTQGAFSYKNIGISANLFYKKALPNLGDYQFGDSWSSESQLFYQWKFKTLQIRPSVGFYTETEKVDQWHNIDQPSTDYHRKFITTGGEIAFKNVSLSGYVQKNIFNEFSGIQLDSKYRWVAELTYYFK